MRILMVVPRYAEGIVGGAETLVRGLATRAAGDGRVVEVATTCAVDHATWANVLPAGESEEDGVRVRRFPVGPRDPETYDRLHARLVEQGRLSYLEELEMMGAGVWSPELQRFIEERGADYDLLVFAPYLFGTTFWGIQAWPDRSALIPCLHDEPDAHMRCLRRPFEAARGCLFNSAAEERLARRLFRVRGGGVVGMGFDPPAGSPPAGFAARHGLGRYLLYAGRLEGAKRVDVLVEHVARFAAARAPDLKLALMGRGSYTVPRRHAGHVVHLGYLDEDEKRAAYAEAVALVNPSELESLSLVLLEAWLERTPALVAAGSEVMREHCERSGGGVAFAEYADFAAALASLLDDPAARARMGAAGREYVLSEYGWPAVSERFAAVTGELAGPPPPPRRRGGR
jgi:glycosyltransferase involved in cell wall biosynthesis